MNPRSLTFPSVTTPVEEARYNTLDNGGYPFGVLIDPGRLSVFLIDKEFVLHHMRFFMAFDEIFIGKSPLSAMTKFSGGYGPEWDGNSIVAKKKGVDNTYCFIGDRIFMFQTKARLTGYVSPVGNNSVPHPWAEDELGNIYLMVGPVILTPTPELMAIPRDFEFDPYSSYFYRNDEFEVTHKGKTYKLQYSTNPGAMYDRCVVNEDGGDEDDLPEWREMDRDAFIAAVKAREKVLGIEPLSIKIINTSI